MRTPRLYFWGRQAILNRKDSALGYVIYDRVFGELHCLECSFYAFNKYVMQRHIASEHPKKKVTKEKKSKRKEESPLTGVKKREPLILKISMKR